MAKILFLMTSADHWTLNDGTKHPTGFWAEEAIAPLEVLTGAGHDVVVATPSGEKPPVDEGSLAPDAAGGEDKAAELRRAIDTAPELQSPVTLADVDLADVDAVFVPGGHGPMQDLYRDVDAGSLLTSAIDQRMPVGVVCHGPAALLAATREDGSNAFAGYTLTAFTNEEEQQGGKADKAPWLLEDQLRNAGLHVITGDAWAPHVETDRTLVSGQNPQSSKDVAEALLTQLAAHGATTT